MIYIMMGTAGKEVQPEIILKICLFFPDVLPTPAKPKSLLLCIQKPENIPKWTRTLTYSLQQK